MAQKIAGTAFVKIDGDQVSLSADMKLAPFGVERSAVVGLSGVAGFKEENVVPMAEMTAIKGSKTDIEKIQNITDSTVTIELATGEVWVYRNAWFAGRLEVDGAEGTFGMRFEALKAERTTSTTEGG